jgi:hypothetical protein
MSAKENILGGLLDNPLIKTLALGKIKKAFNEHGVTLVTVTTDASGELQFDVYTEPMKVMTETDFNKTIQTLIQ